MTVGNIHGDLVATDEGYMTCDLYLAAFLATAGSTMKKTTRDAKKVFFHFEDNEIIQKLRDSYFMRQAPIDALSHADNIKSLKSLCASIMGSQVRRG